jgi:hypothetical protein
MKTTAKRPVPIRGYLLHITHYDPRWYKAKKRERPFDPASGRRVIDALAAEGFNLLVVDIADGVVYASHPELRKPYSLPMSALRDLARHARDKGLGVVPKLNFSKSCGVHHHDEWNLPPGSDWARNFDGERYWARAFELVDEVVDACGPVRFFHIGMDEDHDRSYDQYVKAIKTLRAGLRERKLRTVMWNDSAINYKVGQIHREKAVYAQNRIPRDVIQVLWNYHRVPLKELKAIRERNLELWGAPGSQDTAMACRFRNAVRRLGGRGLLMTRWIPCTERTCKELVASIQTMGPVFRG